ncbi:MAG: hypothetical protein OEU26_12520 [Candidatus Tectomicrobia bacterium]|nr:hypothetical protein [Candidatus Tectomicrobia bacterium]
MGFFWPFVMGAAASWVVQGQINRRRKRQVVMQFNRPYSRTGNELSTLQDQPLDAGRLPAQPAAADGNTGALSVDQETVADDLSAVIVLDRLEHIQGITPAIARRLNQVGILTYADLAGQPPERLWDLVASAEPEDRPVQDWIARARDLACEDDVV